MWFFTRRGRKGKEQGCCCYRTRARTIDSCWKTQQRAAFTLRRLHDGYNTLATLSTAAAVVLSVVF